VKAGFLQQWSIIRFLRLALSIVALVAGIQTQEWALAVIGLLFSIATLATPGCCATGACSTRPAARPNRSDITDVTYEEVKADE